MEFCLSHLYKLILYIINDFETKDYTNQTKLGQLKDNLNKFDYKYLIDINIDFRNAISHGNIELYTDKIVLTEKGIELAKAASKSIASSELVKDTASAAAVGAAIAIPVPFVGPAAGAVVGAALGAYSHVTKKK